MHPLELHRDRLRLGSLQLGVLLLELGQHAGDLQAAVADGRVHFLHAVAAVAASQRLHKNVVLLVGQRHEVAAHLALKRVAALLNIFLSAFLFEPVADLVLGFARLDDVEPVAAGAAVLGAGDDLNNFAGLDLVVDGHDAVIDLRTDHSVADSRVDRVGEVDGRRARGQVDDVAARREGEHFLGQQVALDVAEQIRGVGAGALAFQQLAHPGQALVQLVVAARDAGLVLPVRGDAVLRHAVHVPGADLHLKRDGLASDDRCVQGLVAVGLRGRDVVLEAIGQRVVHIVDQPQRGIALGDVVEDDTHSVNVINFLEILILHIHLAVNAVDALDAVADGRLLDAVFGQVPGNRMADLMQELVAVLIQQVADRLIADRVKVVQTAVLELLLDVGNSEAVRDGGIDLHRFQCLVAALLLGPGVAGAHIVQSVAQFYNHDADILAHGQQHLAQVLGLAILHIRELDLGQLGDAVNEQRDLGAELLLDLGHRDRRVLGHIVHESRGNALAVHAQLHQNLRHRKRVTDVRLAAAAALLAVGLFGQRVGAVNHSKIIGTAAVNQTLFQIVIGDGHFYFLHVCVFHSPFPSPFSICLAQRFFGRSVGRSCLFCQLRQLLQHRRTGQVLLGRHGHGQPAALLLLNQAKLLQRRQACQRLAGVLRPLRRKNRLQIRRGHMPAADTSVE